MSNMLRSYRSPNIIKMQTRDVYLNRLQQRIFYAGARDIRVLGARRFGKTDGVIGPYAWRVASSMPGGTGLWLGSSRKQLYSRTVPGTIAALERFYNIKEGTHFGWGRPPKDIPQSIVRPKSYDNVLWWANGFIDMLISLAVFGSANSITASNIKGDECKFMPKKKIDEEVMPALSGNVHPLGSPAFSEANPFFKSTMFCSDASLSSKNNWLEHEENRLDLVIDDGPFAGKKYRDIQQELDEYADKVMFYNELLRSGKKDGHRVIEVSQEKKQEVAAMYEAVTNREGAYTIVPKQYKDIKAICDYLVNYKVITAEQAELLFNHQFLITTEQKFELMAIRGSKKFQGHINQLRCNSFYFVRASSLDNIDILGEDYIKRMKRDLPPVVFQVSILNIKLGKIGEGFYFRYDPDIHCYTEDSCPAIDNAYTNKQATIITGGTAYKQEYESLDFEMLSSKNDCSLDGDCLDDLPLEIAFDAGKIISWIVTGQLYPRDGKNCLNILSSMFVKNGLMIQDLIRQWSSYYAPHRRKNNNVNFYYDHTFKFKPTGVYVDDIKDTIIKELQRHGWQVNAIPIGQTWPHHQRYKDINEGLSEYSYPSVRFNAENNEALCISIENCGTRISYSGTNSVIKKDKAGEKLAVDAERTTPGAEPEELRTDGTDAFDTLYIGVRHYRSSTMSAFFLPNGR